MLKTLSFTLCVCVCVCVCLFFRLFVCFIQWWFCSFFSIIPAVKGSKSLVVINIDTFKPMTLYEAIRNLLFVNKLKEL